MANMLLYQALKDELKSLIQGFRKDDIVKKAFWEKKVEFELRLLKVSEDY